MKARKMNIIFILSPLTTKTQTCVMYLYDSERFFSNAANLTVS